ncbi:MAG: HIT family protein [Promethearchaeota archaeon]|jgi:histidine triad (HIT) family protein
MRIDNCIFCNILERKMPAKILFEDEHCLAFLDIFPISKGHTIIVPKTHYPTLEDVPDHELCKLFEVVKKISKMIHKKLEIDGYNILQNNFSAAGQLINHFHIHIIPRSLNDIKFTIKTPRTQADEEELDEVLNALK